VHDINNENEIIIWSLHDNRKHRKDFVCCIIMICDIEKTSLYSELSDSITITALEEFDDDLANILTNNISSSSNDDDDENTLTCSSSSIVSVDRDKLQRIRLLGRGQYCNVHLVVGTLPCVSSQQQRTSEKVKQQDQKAMYACKSIDPTCVNGPDEWILAASDLANEAKILSDLDHKNIIKLRALCSEIFSESFGCDSSFFQRHISKTKTNNSTNGGLEGFFLVTDVLTETLADRLNRWRKIESSYTRMDLRQSKLLRSRLLNSESSYMNLRQSKLLRSRLSTSSSSSSNSNSSSSSNSINAMYERIEDVILGIARGMEYLSSQNIVLRDLKPVSFFFLKIRYISRTLYCFSSHTYLWFYSYHEGQHWFR
jgi:hypothetical protein